MLSIYLPITVLSLFTTRESVVKIVEFFKLSREKESIAVRLMIIYCERYFEPQNKYIFFSEEIFLGGSQL